MAKRKKLTSPNSNKKSDAKIAFIILGLFIAGIILFLIVSKSKESSNQIVEVPHEVVHQQAHKIIYKENVSSVPEGVDTYIPNENISPAITTPKSIEKIPGSGGRIAFIIDDWGQTTANCKYLRDIPEPMAVSILPGLRHTKDVAACARLYHKMAMLHLPLEAFRNYDIYPPNYIIKTSMDQALASKVIDQDLDQLPTIEGVNNHMGSKATTDRPLMKLIFKKLKKRGLFFVDSMTAHGTVCSALADEMGLTFGKRDVFLDNVNTHEAIVKQIMELARWARRRGYAVAIGHDRRLTMQVLKEEIPFLEKQGFQIVSIRELLKNR